MTPRKYLIRYQFDQRMVTGGFFSDEPHVFEDGDVIGVVLFNQGGPRMDSEIEACLFKIFMDPALYDIRIDDWVRSGISKMLARRHGRKLSEQYKAIGGESPINRLTQRQARSLERALVQRCAVDKDVTMRVYPATRYGHPSFKETSRTMQDDGVTKVVFLPMFPQYAKGSTGSAFSYWNTLVSAGEIPDWPSTAVRDFATHPKYIQAINDRIDEALQRFPALIQEKVQLIFSAHGAREQDINERNDPYCCRIHETVAAVMKGRSDNRIFEVAFQRGFGKLNWLAPATKQVIESIASAGGEAVLIIPVSYLTDQLETAYGMDINLREKAEENGIKHFEVMAGLNSHPLLNEAFCELIEQCLVKDGFSSADEIQSENLNGHPQELARSFPRCGQCQKCSLDQA